jgi:hypothetical protein
MGALSLEAKRPRQKYRTMEKVHKPSNSDIPFPNSVRGQEYVDVFIHSPIYLYGIILD